MGQILLDSHNYLIYQDTPWDTKILGFKTNEIKEVVYSSEKQLYKTIVKFEEFCISQKYLFTNSRINPDDRMLRKALSEMGYFNSETSLMVDLSINNFKPINNFGNLKFLIREYSAQDLEELRSISFNIFSHGRFFEDPYISIENAKARNKNWINYLIDKSIIIIGELNTTLFGYMAFQLEGDRASLLLGGVKSNFTMYSYPFWQKVFLELINKFEVKHISGIVSASNIRIMNLYSHFDFKFSKTFFGYHKHRMSS
jgi:hypothetical protein